MPKRRTLPQDCIVCFEDPCVCTKKPERPKRPPRQRKPEPEPTPEPVQAAPPPRPSAVDAMRRAAQSAELDRRKQEPLQTASKTSLGEADAMTVQAIRNLQEHFTVEGEDVDKYRGYLKREPTPGERAAAWRARRGAS